MENIFNTMAFGICITVPESGEILFLNSHILNVFGIEPDYKGKTCWELLMGRADRCRSCPIDRLLADPGHPVDRVDCDKSNRIYRLREQPDGVLVSEEYDPLTRRFMFHSDRIIE